ncbi:hypothetical protein BDK51DRAFT_32878, partial [Blyttiomyces helicus]
MPSVPFKVQHGDVRRRFLLPADLPPTWASVEEKVRALFDLSTTPFRTFYEDADGDLILLDTDEELNDLLSSHGVVAAGPVRLTIRMSSAGPGAPLEAGASQRIDVDRVSASAPTGVEPVAYPSAMDVDPLLATRSHAPPPPFEAVDPASTAPKAASGEKADGPDSRPRPVPGVGDEFGEFFEKIREFFNRPDVVALGAIATELYTAITESLAVYFRTVFSAEEGNGSQAERETRRTAARQRMHEAAETAYNQAAEIVKNAQQGNKSRQKARESRDEMRKNRDEMFKNTERA